MDASCIIEPDLKEKRKECGEIPSRFSRDGFSNLLPTAAHIGEHRGGRCPETVLSMREEVRKEEGGRGWKKGR